MSFDCSCDYEPAQFYCAQIRKARKEHRCEECGEKIIPGSKYEYVSGKWDSYVNEFKTCERCVNLRVWVKNNVPCFCWCHGNMLEDARETIEEARYRAPDETAGLMFGFLRRRYAARVAHTTRDRQEDQS